MGDNGAQVVVTSTHQHFRWLLAGAAAGLAVDLSLYPLDTIKTRMQSKGGFRTAGGFAQIYRGIPAVVLGSAPGSAIFFLTYSSSRELFQRKFDIDSNSGYAPLTDALSATLGEICACVARVPTEIVKQRAQTTPNHRLVHIVSELYAGGGGEGKAGVRGFYKGYASTVCREIPFSFIEFPLWEWLKRRLKASTGRQECTPLESAACGSLAGLTAAAITTPLDVLKTRIMLDRSRHTVYLLPLAISILRHEGMRRLYAGMLPRALWMGLGGFVFFFSYEFSLRATEYLF